jgi:hypothetical protein
MNDGIKRIIHHCWLWDIELQRHVKALVIVIGLDPIYYSRRAPPGFYDE